MQFFSFLSSDLNVEYDVGPHELRFGGLKLSYRCLCQKLGGINLDIFYEIARKKKEIVITN